VQRAAAGETVRAEPFDAIELRVGVLFGDVVRRRCSATLFGDNEDDE
jgi:hypothetical protein